jgi:hypothetical protein
MVTVQGNPLPYLVPPIGALANLILSGVLSLIWGAGAKATTWDTAWRSALIMMACLAIIAVTWAAGRARQGVLRAVSMGMSVASCGGLFVLTFRGWSFDLVMVYLIVMATACLGLAIVRLLRGEGGDERPHAFGKVADRVAELKAVGELGKPKVIDGTVSTRVRMEPGTEFAKLQDARGAIATLVPTSKQNVRLIPDPDRPGEGTLEITARDYIEKPPTWPGLTAPGESITEPIHLCVYGNGRPVPLYLPGDAKLHRNAIGLLVIAGQPGAGKTELVLEFSAETISRFNAHLTVIDPRKGDQLPAWLKRAALVISDTRTAETFIADLVDQVPKRAKILGDEGLKQWTAKSSLKFEVVVIDEAAKLIASRNEEEMVELAESVRSVGICIVLVQQRVTVDRMPSSVKKARGGSICMGVADDAEAGRILSESTMAAGASPGSLGNRKPGCLYIEVPGIPEEDWSRMARTYQPPEPEQLAAAVAPFVTDTPAVPVPATRPARSTPAVRRSQVQIMGEDAELVDDDDERDPDDLDLRDDDPDARPEPQDPQVPLSEAGDVRSSIRVPNRPRLAFATDTGDQRWTKATLMDLLRSTLLDAYSRGKTRIKPADLGPVVEHVGPDNLKPPRLSGYLGELCQPGPGQLLRRDRDPGWYVIEPGDDDGVRELAGAPA